MRSQYITENFLRTKKLGEALARKIGDKKRKKALVLGLEGDLGGGKTTFLQGFARGLGAKGRVLSPTFVIMRKFRVRRPGSKFFYHLDCYRIQKPKDILSLGFREIVSNPQNIIAVEWAEKIKKLLPKDALWLRFVFVDKNKRKITIKKNAGN